MAKVSDGIRYKENKGVYEKRFYVDGKRYSVYGKSRKECKEAELTKRSQLASSTYRKNNTITLDEYFKEWQKLKACKPNTLRSYISTYENHISKAIGNTKIQKLERREIQNAILDTSIRISVHTANYSLLIIKMVLSDAVRDGIRFDNPASDIKNIKSNEKSDTIDTIHRALNTQEQTIFFKYAENTIYYNFFRFQLYTGMRPGEVSALRYSDIDYKKNCIHVQRTLTYDAEGKIDTGSPKTDTSSRDIPLSDKTKEIIKAQQSINSILQDSVISIDGLLFPGKNGNMIRCSSLDNGIKHILKRASKDGYHIDVFTAHCFRDTFATLCVEQGMQAHVLQKILGHKTLAMTMNLYYHLPEETKQEEMQKVAFVI